MHTIRHGLLALALTQVAFGAVTPKWPYGQQLDREEYLLYEGSELVSFTIGCTRARIFSAVAAQWIRLVRRVSSESEMLLLEY